MLGAFLSMPRQIVKNDEKDVIETSRWVSQIRKTAKKTGLKTAVAQRLSYWTADCRVAGSNLKNIISFCLSRLFD